MNHLSISADAKKSACQLLETIWNSRGFPVDPFWIASELGLIVLEMELPDNIAGGLVKDADKEPVILLNQIDSRDRKRINCAHKLGRYMDLVMRDSDCYKYVDFRISGTRCAAGVNEKNEIFADYFGDVLLMPEPEVRSLEKQGTRVDLMARHFGVTVSAIEYRRSELVMASDMHALA